MPPQPPPGVTDPDRFFRTDHLNADLGGRSARGGVFTLGAQLFKFVVSMASTIVLARLLTPQDYGLIGMVAILVAFVTMFQYLGLPAATVRWPTLNHQQVSMLFWVNIALSGAVMLVAMASAPVVAWFYHEPRLVGITIGYSFGIFLAGLAIQHEALLSRQMRFAALAVIETTSISAGLVAAVIAAWYGAGYWALVINQLTMPLVRAVEVWIACRWRPGLPVRGAGVRAMLTFGGNLTGFSFMNFFARNLDNALIGKYWGAYQLGLYAKAYQMLLLPMEQINAPFAAVALPALSRLAETPERYRGAYLRMLEKITILTMPGVAFMIATSDWLVLLLLGTQWSATARIFTLLGVAAIIQPVTKTAWWLFSTQGRTREMLHWGIISGLITISAIVAGLPWGAVGVAASYAITDLCLTTPLLFWYIGRRGPVRTADFYRTLAPAACAALSALGVVVLARPWLAGFQLITRLTLALALTACVALLVLAALPAGRLALRSFKEMLFLLVKNWKKETAV